MQPPTATQKLPKVAKTCHKHLCYCTLDVNTETDVDFGTDMKQWYIYMSVYLCVYIYLLLFWIDWSFAFVNIQSNSFNVKNYDFVS